MYLEIYFFAVLIYSISINYYLRCTLLTRPNFTPKRTPESANCHHISMIVFNQYSWKLCCDPTLVSGVMVFYFENLVSLHFFSQSFLFFLLLQRHCKCSSSEVISLLYKLDLLIDHFTQSPSHSFSCHGFHHLINNVISNTDSRMLNRMIEWLKMKKSLNIRYWCSQNLICNTFIMCYMY